MRQGYLFPILLLATILPLHAHRGCMLKPLPLHDRIRSAHAIVEGVVSTSSTEIINDRIHTRWHIDVVRAWDLPVARPSIDVLIEGGIYQQQRLVVIPNASVHSGEHVVLMLDPFDAQTNTYTISSGPQGVMTDREGSFVDAIGTRMADIDLFGQVSAVRGRMPSLPGGGILFSEPIMRSPKQHESVQALTITSLNPTTFTAGTLSALTIRGTGFGVKGANSTVKFVSADEGGEVFGTLPPFHIQTWNDTLIFVLVPCTADDNPTAGTGKVRVITDANEVITTTQQITVNWAQFTNQNTAGTQVDQWSPVELVNDNGQNGYTFTLNAGLAAQNATNLAVRRALSTWRCKTGANLAVAPGTTNATCTNGADGINVITFDGAACQLPNGVLGVCYFYYGACTQGGVQYWRVDDIDLIMDGATNWQFGPGAPVAPQVDFETVALHEIGHGLGLGHVREATAVMYWALGAGEQRRTPLAASDSTGGRSIVNRSTAAHPCGPAAMVAVAAGECNLAAPVALFSANVLRGCAPLTVTFTNTSTNDPTATNWDVNNDGVVDYTSTNCTHTYTTSGTYSVRMSVSNAFGTDEIIKANLIVALSVPLVNAGQDDTVCLGSSNTLGATPVATGSTPFVYRWRPGNVLNDSTVANPVATITSTTTFSVTVTDVNGCARADTMVLTVIPRPIVNAGADTSLCRGSAKTLNAVVTSGLAPYQFQWTPASGLNDPTLQKPIATPTSTTSYVLTVTDVRGCVQSDTVKITVNPLPIVNAGPDTVNICYGGSIQLQPAITSTAQPLSYLWEPSAGLSAVNTPNPIASPIASQVYTITVTDNNGCSKSDQLLIRVIDLPKPVITSPNVGTPCEGQTVRLDAGAGFATYLWSTGATTRTIDVTKAGSYTVRVTNSFTCEGQSVPYVLTLNRTPTPQITGPSQTCVNSTAVYSVTAVSGDAYVWTVTNGTIRSGAGTPTISVQWGSTGTGTVTCKQTSSAGCVGTSAPMNVTFGTVIVPTITVSGSTTLCDGESIELDAGVYSSYQWSTGATTRKITVTTAGSYTVTVAEPGGCSGTSLPIVVTTKPAPATPSIVRTQNTLECSVVGAAYQWSESNTPIPFATQRTYTVVSPGSYRVRVTAENACSATSEPFIVNTVGVREEDVLDVVTISPNPVTDQCMITTQGRWQGGEAIIVDARGVRRAAFVLPNGTSEFAIDTSLLEAGVYTMMVQHDGRSIRLRFVKL